MRKLLIWLNSPSLSRESEDANPDPKSAMPISMRLRRSSSAECKAMSSFSNAFSGGLEQVKKSWDRFLMFGILGFLYTAKAQLATAVSILALGWVLVISGVLWLVDSFYAFSRHGFFPYLLNALVRCVAGYLLIRYPMRARKA